MDAIKLYKRSVSLYKVTGKIDKYVEIHLHFENIFKNVITKSLHRDSEIKVYLKSEVLLFSYLPTWGLCNIREVDIIVGVYDKEFIKPYLIYYINYKFNMKVHQLFF